MNRTLVLGAILFLAGIQQAGAVRVLEQVEGAYELWLADVDLPRSSAGNVTFKACSDCVLEVVPVTASTTYFIGAREVTLAQLSEQARLIREQRDAEARTMVGVQYLLVTKRATRVVMQTLSVR